MSTETLCREQIRLIREELAELGIGRDEPVSGADAVDYLTTLAERLAIEEPAEGREHDDTPSLDDPIRHCDDAGTGEGRFHGRI